MQRTQIYLSDEQRESLNRLAERHQVSLAEVVRRAIDAYLGRTEPRLDRDEVLARTGGSLPELAVPPRSEWDRGYG